MYLCNMEKVSGITEELVSRRFGLPVRGVTNTIRLLDDGVTVPFISRYRKELTGNLDEVAVRNIEKELRSVRELLERKEFVRQAIENAGAMTDAVSRSLSDADSITQVEDIYAPFKPRKRTRATIAREKGLEPLAKIIMSGRAVNLQSTATRFVDNVNVTSNDDALNGALDIIAEWASESIRLRNITRNVYRREASLKTSTVKGKESAVAESAMAQYADFAQTIRRISSHQYLALRRAEREGLIKVKYILNDDVSLDTALSKAFVPHHATPECAEMIQHAVSDASKRLLRPSVENEISAQLKENADRVAIDIFVQNLRQLLLSPPLKGLRVLAIDPGYRTGCKVVALDEQGNLLDDNVIYPTPPRSDFNSAERILRTMIEKHNLRVISLGNGTASRETEIFLKERNIIDKSKIIVVNENGASVYSASELARKEFPDKDVTVRGAVSIGRRLIDPLAELVKIDPKSIGVGQYQHDVNQSLLKDSLDFTVLSCVNAVGIDLNTASECLLSYVSGIGPVLAANIVEYRSEHGGFKSRNELKKVPRLGEKAFQLAAGFLRISDGTEPLDNTGIHPESYGIVKEIAKRLNVRISQLIANNELLDKADAEKLAKEGIGGLQTINDIIAELRKPGRDPRLDDNSDAFVPDVSDFEQLHIGDVVSGIVNNITAFGAFVNLGIKENGLLHISQLSHKRVNAVSDVIKLGQILKVKVIDIDTARRRISLSLLF